MVKELYLRHSFLSRPNRVQDIERSELMLKWEETGGGAWERLRVRICP